ncbi:MAG: hypothetical protein AB7N61_10565 [Acidimicrobiia bacterium]
MNSGAPVDAPTKRRSMSRRDWAMLLGSLVLLLGGLVFLIVSLVGSDSEETNVATGTAAVTSAANAAASTIAAGSFTEPAPIIGDDGSVTYVIPAGTWARKKAGDTIAVIPEKITIKVGQKLILRNEDSGAHIAGPFFVGAGETSTYSSTEPKVVEGDCTIHPAGKFEIDVIA